MSDYPVEKGVLVWETLKVEAIHQGAMVLLAGCPTMMPETAVALSQKTYTLAEVLVLGPVAPLGPLNEDAK